MNLEFGAMICSCKANWNLSVRDIEMFPNLSDAESEDGNSHRGFAWGTGHFGVL